MHLQSLYLYNFRLYKEAAFDFDSGINIIHGANARGKTTLLEAIHFLMTGRSFRTSQTKDLIKEGASHFYLEASFIKFGIEQRLKISFDGLDKKIVHNSTVLSSHSHLIGLIPGVTFHPDDAAIVKGSPLVRRHLMDLQIAQVDPLYVHHLTRYNRAMRQRNHLLRLKNPTAIESWEFEMANGAAYIVEKRLKTVEGLSEQSHSLHQCLSGTAENLNLVYKNGGITGCNGQSAWRQYYLDQFYRQRKREMVLGVTLTGPHKDDLTILIDGKEARFFASEGQQRSCIAAMRMAEWEQLKKQSPDTPPLMMIDDIGIGFDQVRRNKLLDHLRGLNQVFLTTTSDFSLEGRRVAL